MDDAPIVSDDRQETARLKALRALGILDGEVNEPRLLRVARLASRLFDAPKAAVALVDQDRIWRKAFVGYAGPEAPRANDLADKVVSTGRAIDLAAPIRDSQGHVLGALSSRGRARKAPRPPRTFRR